VTIAPQVGVRSLSPGDSILVPLTLIVILGGLAVALLVYVISGGHVLFLPLLLLFPLGLFFGRRR
jgi:hypothetical protein